MEHFCTYFDQNYLLKGLVLLNSLQKFASPSVIWVLCLDEVTYELVDCLGAPNVRRLRLAELEAWEPRLAAARLDRTLVEYYWTCTPSLIAYVLAQQPGGAVVTYVDADLCFYASPAPIFEELGQKSVLIHEHRFPPALAHMAADSGIYNVGLMCFRADEQGWSALRWWQSACLEACYLRPEQGYCGDQKYLDDWPSRFEGVHVLQHPGAGLAPWNATRYTYRAHDGALLVDDLPLIFFHYHAFLLFTPRLYGQRGYTIPPALRKPVYLAYVTALQAALAKVRQHCPRFRAGFGWLGLLELLGHLRFGRIFWR